jgi:hypothetical protein
MDPFPRLRRAPLPSPPLASPSSQPVSPLSPVLPSRETYSHHVHPARGADWLPQDRKGGWSFATGLPRIAGCPLVCVRPAGSEHTHQTSETRSAHSPAGLDGLFLVGPAGWIPTIMAFFSDGDSHSSLGDAGRGVLMALYWGRTVKVQCLSVDLTGNHTRRPLGLACSRRASCVSAPPLPSRFLHWHDPTLWDAAS